MNKNNLINKLYSKLSLSKNGRSVFTEKIEHYALKRLGITVEELDPPRIEVEDMNNALREILEETIGDETNFKEEVYEIAFGDDAINKDYTEKEVLLKLREFSDLALEADKIIFICDECQREFTKNKDGSYNGTECNCKASYTMREE